MAPYGSLWLLFLMAPYGSYRSLWLFMAHMARGFVWCFPFPSWTRLTRPGRRANYEKPFEVFECQSGICFEEGSRKWCKQPMQGERKLSEQSVKIDHHKKCWRVSFWRATRSSEPVLVTVFARELATMLAGLMRIVWALRRTDQPVGASDAHGRVGDDCGE